MGMFDAHAHLPQLLHTFAGVVAGLLIEVASHLFLVVLRDIRVIADHVGNGDVLGALEVQSPHRWHWPGSSRGWTRALSSRIASAFDPHARAAADPYPSDRAS